MRPLTLSLSGLHSYRDETTIDFAHLTERGLFGIFGPTGAGKSTILDAITLALYGVIARGTIGDAITKGHDRCRISFTFTIRHEEEPTTFTVERSWKINPSGMTAKAVLMRHAEDEEEPIPIAEKSGDVTKGVTDILGIEVEDFSRTVILPQGTFAEFLSLTEKDRGSMLRRIFGLEELGRRIDERSRAMQVDLERSTERRDELLAELKQYDDATVKDLRTRLADAEKTAEKCDEELTAITKRFADAEHLLERITERERLQEEEEKRSERTDEIEQKKRRLLRADAAAEVAEIVNSAERAIEAAKRAEKELAAAAQEKEKIAATLEPLRREKEKIERARAKGGRIADVIATIDLLGTIAPIDERIGTIVRENADRQKKIAAATKEHETKKTDLHAQKKRLDSLTEEIARLASEEEQTGKKLRDVEEKKPAIATLLDVARRIEKLVKETEQKEREKKGSDEATTQLQKKLADLDASLERSRAEKKQAIERVAEIERSNAAALLVENLADGEPCPLCGSREHPLPYHTEETADLDAARSRARECEDATAKLETSRADLAGKLAASTATGEQIAARLDELRKDREEVDAEVAGFLESSPYTGAVDVPTLTGFQSQCEKLITERTTQIEEIRTKKKGKEEERTTRDNSLRTLESDVTGLLRDVENERRELTRLVNELTELRRRRTTAFAAIDLDQTTIPEGTAGSKQQELKAELDTFEAHAKQVTDSYTDAQTRATAIDSDWKNAEKRVAEESKERGDAVRRRDDGLTQREFASVEEYGQASLSSEERTTLRTQIDQEEIASRRRRDRITELTASIGDQTMTAEEVAALRTEHVAAKAKREEALQEVGGIRSALQRAEENNARLKQLEKEGSAQQKELETVRKLRQYIQGNRFVDFLAGDRLAHICRTASTELRKLTSGRLEITVSPGSGFAIVDHANGANERPTTTLSGGETFLVSLSLALALSESLQSRGAPLDLFFLDEGFGTLDSETLETVIEALERIREDTGRVIGLISHVEALQERVPRRWVVG